MGFIKKINKVMHFKMDFDEKHNEPKKVDLLSKNVRYRQNLNFMCMFAMVTRIKYFETSPLSYIVMTPYFYVMILKIMRSYTKYH